MIKQIYLYLWLIVKYQTSVYQVFFLKNPKEGKKDYLIGKKYSRGYGSPAKTIMNTHRQVSNILFSYSYSMKFSKDPTK